MQFSPFRPRVPLVAVLVAVLATLGLAACGDDGGTSSSTTPAGDSPASTAKPSGTITVYSGRSETLIKPLFEQFTAATGIKVEFRAGDSGALAGQILTEGKATQADVFFSQDAGALGALTKAKVADPLPKAVLDKVPATYRAKDGTWVGASGRVRVIVYNPAQVATPPTTIDGLLDARWQGKIGFAPTNASWQSFVTGLRILRGEEGAKKWLTDFAKLQPKSYSGNGAVRDAVDKGEIAMGLVNHYYLFEKIAKEGQAAVTAKNQYLPGDPGGLVNVAGVAVLSASDNKPAALAFVEYLLSDAAQKYFAETTFEYPLTSTVKPSVQVPALADLKPPALDLSDLDTLAKTQELLVSTGLLTR